MCNVSFWRRAGAILLVAVCTLIVPSLAKADNPIRVGLSVALTGGVAAAGKQVLAGLQIWRDDVNAKGGLLGRPVELVFYDDQSNPQNVPALYTKLIEVDKVDLLIGPYATNMVAPAIPVLMPRPKTVAILAADAEFAQNAAEGARQSIKQVGDFEIVSEQKYPPPTTDFAPVMQAIKAVNPDIVYVAAYPTDSVGIIRAANEIGLTPKMFGGTLIGLLITPIKAQLGQLINGIVNNEVFVPGPAFTFPGTLELLSKYREVAKSQGLDPMGWSYPPLGYAAGQVLAQAVEGAKTMDQVKLAAYMHDHAFHTVVGEISFGKDGEWTKSRVVFTQFQNVTSNSMDQFKDTTHEVIVWPDQHKSGNMIYPYAAAKKL